MITNKKWKVARIMASVLFLTATGLAFLGIGSELMQVQFGPALMRGITAVTAGTLAIILGIVLVTFFFGRIYCAVFCPLGILQDFCGWITRRKGKAMPNFSKTRYGIAGIVFGLLACGWSSGFLLLDPYSNFGRIFGGVTLGAMIPLTLIGILAVWKKRLFCTMICPVGTILGLIARKSVFRLKIGEKCVRCGQCAATCPAGCIDTKAGTIDKERCIRCMNCVSACPLGEIAFAGPEKAVHPLDSSRREFLIRGGVLLAGLAAGAVLAKTGMVRLAEFAKKNRILPPGAGNAERFAAKCTACQLCTTNCPANIIVPAAGGDGPVSLDLNEGACQFECNHCSQVCPTGALPPLTLEAKQRTKIAEAQFHPQNCIVFQEGEACGKCAGVCPVHAIILRKNGSPRPVNTARCIGCGACRSVCPAKEKAISLHEIEEQIRLDT